MEVGNALPKNQRVPPGGARSRRDLTPPFRGGKSAHLETDLEMGGKKTRKMNKQGPCLRKGWKSHLLGRWWEKKKEGIGLKKTCAKKIGPLVTVHRLPLCFRQLNVEKQKTRPCCWETKGGRKCLEDGPNQSRSLYHWKVGGGESIIALYKKGTNKEEKTKGKEITGRGKKSKRKCHDAVLSLVKKKKFARRDESGKGKRGAIVARANCEGKGKTGKRGGGEGPMLAVVILKKKVSRNIQGREVILRGEFGRWAP